MCGDSVRRLWRWISAGGRANWNGTGRRALDRRDGQERVPGVPGRGQGRGSAVPAEQGGRGFTGEGWETNTDYDLIGDPRAVKGGVFREVPARFSRPRSAANGPEANTVLEQHDRQHGVRNAAGPPSDDARLHAGVGHALADLADKLTYRFRLDPERAIVRRTPVTADDVVASWTFMVDKGLQDPMNELVYASSSKPVAESKYIVRVKSKELNWRNFLYFCGAMPICPPTS